MKRLTRNSREGMFLGVCAGIADYFGIDPTLVRLVWVISGLFRWCGLVRLLDCGFHHARGLSLSKVERRKDYETTI